MACCAAALVLTSALKAQTFTTLFSFDGFSDGGRPRALILSDNTLYGTTIDGGSGNDGTVFAVNTDGTGFTTLHSFTAFTVGGINSDGINPLGGLILSGNTLYGTAGRGGSEAGGTLFAVNTDGTGFTTLHSFSAAITNSFGVFTNSDGVDPAAGLILSGDTLYGTASGGGSSGNGTVFAVNTDGTGFTNLYSFTASPDAFPQTNRDGAHPICVLLLSDSTLYGPADEGGSSGNGTVFAIKSDGTGFTTLYNFSAFPNGDGAFPEAGLILSDNTLYGTAPNGGSSGRGTVFSISLPVSPPQLTITLAGANVILTWPTNASGFTLQSTTSLVSPAVWSTNSPALVVVNGQNTVINPISGTQQFYRLSQ